MQLMLAILAHRQSYYTISNAIFANMKEGIDILGEQQKSPKTRLHMTPPRKNTQKKGPRRPAQKGRGQLLQKK